MKIKTNDLVLEIGSGDNPKPRSDVLCDMLPEDDTQRGGKITLDRPFIAADGQYLPFVDKSFDYIICCHVLEHADDPELFLSELMRVGKAGYIETPTEIGEKLYGWQYHKWLIKLDNDKLILKKKIEESQFGQLFHYLYLTDNIYAKFHTQNHHLFLIQYEWVEKINYEIVEPDRIFIDLNNLVEVNKLLYKQTGFNLTSFVKNLIPISIRRLAKSAIVKGQGRSNRTLESIKSIIVCPVCKNKVDWNENIISCLRCGRKYPIKNGIPFLLRQDR